MKNLKRAVQIMEERIGSLQAMSSFYECSSWGFESTAFINAVVILSTKRSPRYCFMTAQSIESEMGRKRSKGGYADRIIDLDILSYGSRTIDTVDLIIPHPRAHKRRFVLQPWSEIRPDYVVPTFDLRVSELLDECLDSSEYEVLRDV